jgi:hypothetical protein
MERIKFTIKALLTDENSVSFISNSRGVHYSMTPSEISRWTIETHIHKREVFKVPVEQTITWPITSSITENCIQENRFRILDTKYIEITEFKAENWKFVYEKWGVISKSESDRDIETKYIVPKTLEEFNADKSNHWQEAEYNLETDSNGFYWEVDTGNWAWHWPTIDDYMNYITKIKRENSEREPFERIERIDISFFID